MKNLPQEYYNSKGDRMRDCESDGSRTRIGVAWVAWRGLPFGAWMSMLLVLQVATVTAAES